MLKDLGSSVVAEQAVSTATPISSPATAPKSSSEQQSNHQRSGLTMAKDTDSIDTPLTNTPTSNDSLQCQGAKTLPSPPPQSPPLVDPIDLASIAHMKASGLPIPIQPVIVDSEFKPLSPEEIDDLMRQRTVRKSRCGNYEHSTWPKSYTGFEVEHALQGGDIMRGEEELEDELEELEVKGIATAGLVSDGWRDTRGLAVVKGDVERPTAK